ncbi:unnamed protein product [Prunus armeniaca]|uniref:Uncharacterized protein n=1 Tax=Prunus armeniaca TaxID=36596 RepID=A0A6J5V968_PRUAR|nr:unnamed protein product [Prunus armeniaca]
MQSTCHQNRCRHLRSDLALIWSSPRDARNSSDPPAKRRRFLLTGVSVSLRRVAGDDGKKISGSGHVHRNPEAREEG